MATLECDNAAVVSVLSTGKTKTSILEPYARNIRMLAAAFHVKLK